MKEILSFEIPISGFALYFKLNNYYRINMKLENIEDLFFIKAFSNDFKLYASYTGDIFIQTKNVGAYLGTFEKEIFIFYDNENRIVYFKWINDDFVSFLIDDTYKLSSDLKITIKPQYVQIEKIYYRSSFIAPTTDLSSFIKLYEHH